MNSAENVSVKPLEWSKIENPSSGDECETADTPFGSYGITADEFSYSPLTAYYLDGPNGFNRHFASVPEAKAAAQADYEQRIRSCLRPPPTEDADRVEPVAWQVVHGGGATFWNVESNAHSNAQATSGIVIPLYASPRPDPVGVTEAMVERMALDVTKRIEREFYYDQPGGATQTRGKVQSIVAEALTAALSPQEGK